MVMKHERAKLVAWKAQRTPSPCPNAYGTL